MKISHSYPPNYAAVLAKFPFAARPSVIFTYGDTVYVPDGTPLTKALQAHEQVHVERQCAAIGPKAWWEQYLESAAFRLAEELPAHIAEWQAHRRRHGPSPKMLAAIADRLSGPLYENIVSRSQAQHLILTGGKQAVAA